MVVKQAKKKVSISGKGGVRNVGFAGGYFER